MQLIIVKSILTKGVELLYNSYAKSNFDTTTEIVSLSRGLFFEAFLFLVRNYEWASNFLYWWA